MKTDIYLEYSGNAWSRLKARKGAMISLATLTLFIILAFIVPYLSPYAYYTIHLEFKNLPPCPNFWFGTDELGRDIFTRIWWGARISLFIGISAAVIDLIIGVIYGSVAALWGRKLDEILMRIADIIYSLPHFLMVILLIVVMGSGLMTIITALTITGWIPMSRIVRGQVMQLKELEYVQAAFALGASKGRVLLRHLLPNAIGPIITTVSFTVPIAIFAEAFLSFIGLGVQSPIASWGTMAHDGLFALYYFPWRLFFPALFITITMLCFSILGDSVRDSFDPRLKL